MAYTPLSDARTVAQRTRYQALTKDNPFSPYINYEVRQGLEPTEWYIEGDGGEAFGSEGL